MIDPALPDDAAALRNRWRVWDTVEPVAAWSLEVPLPEDRSAQERFLRDVCAALDDSGIVHIDAVDVPGSPSLTAGERWPDAWAGQGGGELFPFEAALFDGDGEVTLSSTVAVVDRRGAVVTERADDGGRLLRALEPGLDEVYARHFAAARPFAGVWSSSSGRLVEITVGFWSDIFTVAGQASEANRIRAAACQRRLAAIARALGGEFSA